MGKIYSRPEKKDVEVFTNADQHYTSGQLAELLKCNDDPQYFIDNYLKILDLKLGVMPFTTRSYQQVQLSTMQSKNLFCLQPRQSGATVLPLAYQLWEALFRPNTQHGSAFVKYTQSVESIDLIHYWYVNLPKWLVPTITYRNRTIVEFGNGSRIVAGIICGNFNRGRSWTTLYADCLSFAKERDQEDFWLVAVSSLISGRIFITGTPNGSANTFAYVWESLLKTRNPYFVTMHIDPLAMYDQSKLDQILGVVGLRNFLREYKCEFIA